MTEEFKIQQQTVPEQGQNQEQMQILLKETMKENKSLMNKNAKLQTKYVELFKQHKLLKKDHAVFINFFIRYFKEGQEGQKQRFQQFGVGQYELAQLQKLTNRKQSVLINRIEELQRQAEQKEKERVIEREQKLIQAKEELKKSYEQRLREARNVSNRQINDYLKELESFRKSSQVQTEEIYELRNSIELKTNELSKLAKDKLKLQHQLNTIRKKQIALQLSVDKEQEHGKDNSQRNQFIALRHQVSELMMKRDQLRQQNKDKAQEITKERKRNQVLQDEIQKIKQFQLQMNEKYELVRQCSLEELYNLILTRDQPQQISFSQQVEPLKQKIAADQDDEEIQRQYLKNVLIRYIKAETSGTFDQSLILLQIIGNLLKLDPSLSKALETYKHRRKQWWYIKY